MLLVRISCTVLIGSASSCATSAQRLLSFCQRPITWPLLRQGIRPIGNDSGLRHLCLPFWLQPPCLIFSTSRLLPLTGLPGSFLRHDQPSRMCTIQRRLDAASPAPSLLFSSFQSSAVFLLQHFHSDISINRASSAPSLSFF